MKSIKFYFGVKKKEKNKLVCNKSTIIIDYFKKY